MCGSAHVYIACTVIHRLRCGVAKGLVSYGDCYIRGVRTLQPHRLQTAMSLYSEKLSALILLVDGRLNSLTDNKKGTYCITCHLFGSILVLYKLHQILMKY